MVVVGMTRRYCHLTQSVGGLLDQTVPENLLEDYRSQDLILA